MVNWKKWFLEEDEEEIYLGESTKKGESKKNEEENFEEDFEIEFSQESPVKETEEEESEEYTKASSEELVEEYDDFEDFEEYELEDEAKKETGFLSKIKGLFAGKTSYSEEDLELEEAEEKEIDLSEYADIEEPEDYKTYLERQKNSQTSESIDSEVEEESENKKSFFKVLKEKLFTVSDEEIEKEELEVDLTEYEEEKSEDEYEEEVLETEQVEEISEIKEDKINLEDYEVEELPETKEENIEQVTDLDSTLKQLGVEKAEIKDVDIFGEKSERRAHPTLAAVRTKRLKQEHSMDNLHRDIILEKDHSEFKADLSKKSSLENSDNLLLEEKRESKNKEEIEKLKSDFNKIERKEKISSDEIFESSNRSSELDRVLDEIEEKEKESQQKYTEELELRKPELQEERRDKLKYTTVDDILNGTEDLFEDDIDRTSKKTIGERFEDEEPSEEINNFREDIYGNKEKVAPGETPLDQLIESEKIDVYNKERETLGELKQLNSNLEELRKEKIVEEEKIEDEEDIIEKVSKIEDIEIESYDEIKEVKKDILAEYSDYHLDEEEIKELQKQNKIDSNADKIDIDTLTKDVAPNAKSIGINNDVDKFVEEKVVPTELVQKRQENQESNENTEDKEPKKEIEETSGIEYTEKLYSEEVEDYFEEPKAYTLGEYKTVDRGYRPVSKEKIENNQKILEAIFEKYSSNSMNVGRKSVTSEIMETQTITPKTKTLGKFKPSPVYSSVYGSGPRTSNVSNRGKQEGGKNTKTSNATGASLYKEIASQEETVWNIGSSKRVPKNKVKAKNTKK